jgi:hypothetical protein
MLYDKANEVALDVARGFEPFAGSAPCLSW